MKRRHSESGFAMLMVFVLAAAIAIALYMELPRVVFESERAKEQILVDRGNEYKRAIQLYVRRVRKYPSKIDDLESTSNIRFLRRRYKDPLTGKDEWRLIHIGPAGQLTDSLIQRLDPLKNGKDKSLNASSSPDGSTGDPNAATGTDPQTGQLWARGRPSDKVLTSANGGPPPAPEDANGPPQPQYPQQPQYPAGQPGYPPQPQFPVANTGQPFNPAPPGQANTAAGIIQQILTTPRQLPAGVGYPAPGSPAGFNSPNGFNAQGNYQPQSGQAGNQLQPGQPGQPSNPSSGSTFNNPSGTTGINASTNIGAGGGGIAGVASTASGSGIMVINDRRKFREWEFVYDVTKDKTMGGGVQNQQPQNQQQLNSRQRSLENRQ